MECNNVDTAVGSVAFSLQWSQFGLVLITMLSHSMDITTKLELKHKNMSILTHGYTQDAKPNLLGVVTQERYL